MFLLVFEDFSLGKADVLTESLFTNCGNGYVDIVDISDPQNPKVYDPNNGNWIDV